MVYYGTEAYCTNTNIKQIDSMLQCVCSVKDQRRCQNVTRTPVTYSAIASFCSYHILTIEETHGNIESKFCSIYMYVLTIFVTNLVLGISVCFVLRLGLLMPSLFVAAST